MFLHLRYIVEVCCVKSVKTWVQLDQM